MDWKPLPHVIEGLKGAPFSPDGYQNFVFQWDRQFFEERVEMVGFEGGETTLDAGCGFGQFSAGLARYNRHVIAFDRADWMVQTAEILKERWSISNMEVRKGSLPDLPFADDSFDYIWCSGVVMFTDRDACFREFHRTLKPGGRLYIMMNSWGRWLFKAARARGSGTDASLRACLEAIGKSAFDGSPRNYLTLDTAGPYCDKLGFTLIGVASDGCLDLKDRGRKRPMFDETIRLTVGDAADVVVDNNIEFVAEKCRVSRPSGSHQMDSDALIVTTPVKMGDTRHGAFSRWIRRFR